ncbi:Hrb27C [Symbiodinium natans]|uniref:Hrb27C protein n=1 Tax=Symbiodinium natans TaxID=878477 RepID=A0A812J256_9DINO|nr:Hrb27C [Symbiodinium natans]
MAEEDDAAARAKDAANLDAAAKAALASLQGANFSGRGEDGGIQQRPAPQAPGGSEKQDRLFVSKVPQSLGQAELRAHFAQFGDLTDVYLPSAPGSGGHKGICFVSFADASGIQKAIAHGVHEVQGSPISVDIAAPRAPPPSTVTASVQSGCRVFLTKVTADVMRADLQAYFCRFGELSDCYVPPGNKGIAFVSFKDPSTASSVVAHQQHEVKPGVVLIAAPAFDRPQPGSKGGGKGGYGCCGGGCNAFSGACDGCDPAGNFGGYGGGSSCSGCGFSDGTSMGFQQNGFPQAGCANQQSFGAPACGASLQGFPQGFGSLGGFMPQGGCGMGQFQANQLVPPQGMGFANWGVQQPMDQATYGAFQQPQMQMMQRPGPY